MVKDDSNQTGNVFVKYASTGEINARQIGADSEVSLATEVTWEDYARAERFLPQNIGKLAFRLEITPNWIGTVSYTHLDVYKRQVLHITSKTALPCVWSKTCLGVAVIRSYICP